MNKNLGTIKDDSGAAAVIVAILSVVIFGIAAFAVDMGLALSSKRELSVTSDAAALAGADAAAVAWRTQFPAATPCTGAVAQAVTPAATTAAVALHNAQLPMGSAGDPTVEVTCGSDGELDVEVTSRAKHSTVFGNLFGVAELTPASNATARVSGSPAYSGLRPYAICIDDVQITGGGPLPGGIGPVKQSVFTSGQNPQSEGSVSCDGTPPGNWGLVDFDGGSNRNPDLVDWTEFGYDGSLGRFPQNLSGDPGADFNSGPLQDALDSIVGEVVLLPVASAWNVPGEGGNPGNGPGGGNNATFRAEGLASVEICGWYISGGKNNRGECWDDTLLSGAPDDADLILQWRQVAWTTSYNGGGGDVGECDLATNPLCVPTVRLYY